MLVLRWLAVVCWLTFVGCGDGGSDKGDAGTGPACSDGKDNDGDGATDFPDDLSCANASGTSEEGAAAPQCSDGRDNDGDGKTDFPNDPGCFSPQADDERDDCPDGASCAQCGNGRDDDQNGKIDFPDDTGCESAADNSEFQSNPNACGGGLKIKQLPANGMDSGMLDTSSLSQIVSPCGGGMGAPAVAYVVHLPEPKVLVITTDLPGTTADTVVDIRSQMCMDPMSEIACSDNIGMSNNRSALTQSLAAGVYYIIVQGKTAAATGAYALKVERFQGEGTTCTDQANCGPGLLCRVPAGQTGLKCSKPVCKDGLDDDGDTKIDYPNDPGCANADDDTENDTCPGVGCPECGDGIDNDSDSLTDFPADLTCKAAADSSESCTTTEGVISLTAPATMGDTSTATSDLNPTCASSSGSGPDRTYRLDVPALTSLDLNLTASFDTVTVLLNSTCGGTALACSDPLNMHMNALAAGSYYFVVDGWSASSSGTYTINTSGKIANGAACDAHPLAQSGALTCGSGYACKGTAGAKTCQPAECADTVDNNADGKTDFPTDPGCDSASDDTETTVCPGAACPVCSNGIDDDMDNQIDYPADTSCFAASGTSESCASSEAVSVLTTAATMATTVGATNDTKPSCASSSGVAPDLHHQLDLPAMTSLSLSLTGKSPAFWDSVFALYGSSCGGTALSCQDGDTMSLTNLAAGRYYLVVDGWSTGSGAYTVNVSGSIAAGQSCESPLAQSGAITCTAGYTCGGPVGSRVCQPGECNDGVDNNADGKIDFPNDPGCSSSSDATENTVCPGANCPVCSNTTDDDTDTQIDYPADFGCSSAAGSTEVFCSVEPNVAMTPISAPTTNGDLSVMADNYDQTCQSNTGNDMAFALQLPVPVASLVIDTELSTVSDTVISLKDAACGVQLGCDDDGSTGPTTGLLSVLSVANVPAGNYAIQVDSYSTSNNGAFTLRVKGTVATMTSCTSPLFTSGVLVCPTGTTCTGTPARCQ